MFKIPPSLRPALLATLLLACSAVKAQDRIVLASIVDKDSYADRLLQLIYTDAFRQLHLDMELRYYPAARASVKSKAGKVDGEASRAYEYGAPRPELLRVEAVVLEVTMSAFAHAPGIHVRGLESLRGTGYRIEYRAGYAMAARVLAGVVPPARLSSVVDSQFGLKKLAIGRSDLFVDVEETVLPLLDVEPFKGAGIYKAGVLDVFPVYCYLGRQHAELVPKLTEVLKKMKANGTMERYRAMARTPSPPPH